MQGHPAATDAASILLVSCYELGRQPISLAGAAGHFRARGLVTRSLDLALEPLNEDAVRAARLVAISVPMHTALRIGIGAARRIREVNPDCHIAFFGLYAALNADYLLDTVADTCLGAEAEAALCDLANRLAAGEDDTALRPDPAAELARGRKARDVAPDRSGLLPLRRYVKLAIGDELRTVGAVAATRGCKHVCRHCPLPPVYKGRFYALPVESVMADIRQLVGEGAQHITFADPDFLNGPTHAARVARTLHEAFPSVTFDFTAKVEHLLAHEALLGELRELGCLFVVSAVESLSDRTLAALHKRHTPQDVIEVVDAFRRIGLHLRPTFVPFTPWDTLDDYAALIDFIDREALHDQVEPIQLAIRLLVPPGSLLLESPEMRPHLRQLDAENLTWRWQHPDPAMDRLQEAVASAAHDGVRTGEDNRQTFRRIAGLAATAAGRTTRPLEADSAPADIRDRVKPPRLTEDWFC